MVCSSYYSVETNGAFNDYKVIDNPYQLATVTKDINCFGEFLGYIFLPSFVPSGDADLK